MARSPLCSSSNFIKIAFLWVANAALLRFRVLVMNITSDASAVMPTYNRIPVDFEYGEGSYLFDTNGNKYLDGISGIGVCALGHQHPRFTHAIHEQANKLIHTSNLYGIPLQNELAQKL